MMEVHFECLESHMPDRSHTLSYVLSAKEEDALSQLQSALTQALQAIQNHRPSETLEDFQRLVDDCVEQGPDAIKAYLIPSKPNVALCRSLDALMAALQDASADATLGRDTRDLLRRIGDRRMDHLGTHHHMRLHQTLGEVVADRVTPELSIPTGIGLSSQRFYSPANYRDAVIRQTMNVARERVEARLDTDGLNRRMATLADDLAQHVGKTASLHDLPNYPDIAEAARKAAQLAQDILGHPRCG